MTSAFGLAEPAELPALVSEDGKTWWVWCTHCRRKHMHGLEPGHRAAHCFRPGSPYEGTGYVGVTSGARTITELKALTLPTGPASGSASRAESELPVPTAVYKTYDAGWMPLYIGISDNFGRRWQQHARKQPWWPEVAHQTVDWYDDEPTARAVEFAAILAENPRWNVVGKGRAARRKAGAA